MPTPRPPSSSSFLPFFLLFISFFPATIRSASSYSFIYGGCSQQRYFTPSPYQSNLDSVLASLANAAFSDLYAHFTVGKDGDPTTITGLFQCRGDLTAGGGDCSHCVQDAIGQLHPLCPQACGASLQLDSCFVKYDNATFLGVLDTTLIYKKCSSSAANAYDSDFLGRRDDVLRQLSSGGSYFRTASSSGFVLGEAQCLGDLSSGDCTQCVTEAVERLREVCGSALSGDVYLGKCYARYSSAGLYSHASHDSQGGDEAGKTLAIIIGLFAGVALIIVFLSFLRKVCSGKGY
ncbi:plasmodesmata-located protein 6-like [Nymphaea colorata]|nr:plasmodesmata-located protein 6-like [Nymphaea colorata]